MFKLANPTSSFDPSRLRAGVDETVRDEDMPVDQVISFRSQPIAGFCRVPVGAMRFYPVQGRILNMLAYLSAMKEPDKPGSWYRITSGRSAALLLREKDARRRAIVALEAGGAIEVMRQKGKSPFIRLSETASAAFLPPNAISGGLRGR